VSHPRIPLSEPCLNGRELEYLAQCVDTNMVSSVGPFVERFEAAFAEFVGVPYAVACSSGTAALHVAMLLSRIAPGDCVAVSSFTFIASVNAVTYAGADPLLVDSEMRTWNLDTEELHDHVVQASEDGRRLPKAIEAVHVLGRPADLEPLLELHDHFGTLIIEDAAESLGAKYPSGPSAGHQVGTVGDIGCFSFNGNKVITTGGGGMIVTTDTALAERARHLTTQARLPGPDYDHDEVGYNYRMTNVAAALGLAQLEQLPEFLARKRDIADRYRAGFEDVERLLFASIPRDMCASWWLSSVLLRDVASRDSTINALQRMGIEIRRLWKPIHKQRPYQNALRIGGTRAEELHARGIALPSSVHLSVEAQQRVIDAIISVLSNDNA
jgi:dTDP-4-amino-4,6-dideoxygalactose transaminase